MIKGLIFDLDGVLLDTEPIHFEAYRRALQEVSYKLTSNDFENHFRSKGRRHGITSVLGKGADVEAIGQRKDWHFNELLKEKPKVIYGDVLGVLECLSASPIEMAVATGSKRGRELLATYDLIKYFSYVITSGDVDKNKPAPDVYLQCLQCLGLKKEEVLVFEDSLTGIRAAESAGLTVYGIRTFQDVAVHAYPNLMIAVKDLAEKGLIKLM